MTQAQLDHAVARSTGESLRTIRHLGFGIDVGGPPDLEPEDLHLAVDCPSCGRPCPLSAGPSTSAVCEPCDIDFDYRPDEVYAAAEPAADAA
jgi:hypothetical protein